MKKRSQIQAQIYFWVLCLFVSVSAWAQPQIQFTVLEHDFGNATAGDVLNHEFVFTNTGDEPLEIKTIQTTCGCTAAEPTQKIIPASATGVISVTLTASGHEKVTHRANVESNAANTPNVTLVVSAMVRRVWDFHPKATIAFMNVPFEHQRVEKVYVKNLDEKPFTIKSVRVAKEGFQAGFGEPEPSGVPVYVTFTAGSKKGQLTDTLWIETDYKENPVAKTSLFATVTGNIILSSKQMYFGLVPPGGVAEKVLKVTLTPSIHKPDFAITEVSDDKNMVSVKHVETANDGGFLVTLQFKAPRLNGYKSGKLDIHTNLESEPVAELPYSALIRAPRQANR
jgi:hypothetical protein